MQGLDRSTLAAQALGLTDEATGALVPPLHAATTFLRDPDNAYRRGFDYARDANPTFLPPERVVARLEGGAEAMLYASGMAAATAVFGRLRPGEHCLAPTGALLGAAQMARHPPPAFGIELDLVPMDDLDAVRAAVRAGRTRLVWAETPANPTWVVSDLAALAEIAHGAGAILAVDNTVPTPILTRPIEHGADLVMHSATKYLNGHSDVVAGVLVAARADAVWAELRAERAASGAILGPFEAWLLLRGLRTLALRVEAASANAMHLASALAAMRASSACSIPACRPTRGTPSPAARWASGSAGCCRSW